MEKKSLLINDRVHILTTPKCNIPKLCKYCYNERQELNADPFFMREESAQQIREFLDKHNVNVSGKNVGSLSFSGGEPTTHPKFTNIVKAFKGLGSNTSVITNGIPLNRNKIEKLIEAGLTQFQFSVDTLLQENTKLVNHRFPQDKKKLFDCINYSNQLLGNTKLSAVILNENLFEIGEIFNYCRENGITDLMFNAFSTGDWGNIEQTPTIEDMARELPITDNTPKRQKQDRYVYDIDGVEVTLNPPLDKVTFSQIRDTKNGAQVFAPNKSWTPIDFNASFEEAHKLFNGTEKE